jgi:hypothetical protein
MLIILTYHCCIHSMMHRILANMEVEGSTQYSQDLVGRMVLWWNCWTNMVQPWYQHRIALQRTSSKRRRHNEVTTLLACITQPPVTSVCCTCTKLLYICMVHTVVLLQCLGWYNHPTQHVNILSQTLYIGDMFRLYVHIRHQPSPNHTAQGHQGIPSGDV